VTYRVIVTGGAGFIGSTLIKYLAREIGAVTLNIDKLTCAVTLSSLAKVSGSTSLVPPMQILAAARPRAALCEFRRTS
jgi:dTDP-D-glucose 4,6-dehydratase